MHPITIASFVDELSKIAHEKIAIDAAMFERIGAKAVKRGWSGAREGQAIRRLAKAEGRAVGKATGAHSTHSPTMFADTAIKQVPQNPTRVARPGAVPGGTQAGVMPNSIKPSGNLRKNLAIGGAAAATGAMAGYAMPHRQQ